MPFYKNMALELTDKIELVLSFNKAAIIMASVIEDPDLRRGFEAVLGAAEVDLESILGVISSSEMRDFLGEAPV